MSRITMQDPKEATGQLATLFRTVQTKLGLVPNMMKALGSSPAVLEAYLGLSETLGRTSLSAALRERIALHVGEINACGYCLSAHSAIAARMGLDPDAIGDARRGKAMIEARRCAACHDFGGVERPGPPEATAPRRPRGGPRGRARTGAPRRGSA